jgi:hypothetical protein
MCEERSSQYLVIHYFPSRQVKVYRSGSHENGHRTALSPSYADSLLPGQGSLGGLCRMFPQMALQPQTVPRNLLYHGAYAYTNTQ